MFPKPSSPRKIAVASATWLLGCASIVHAGNPAIVESIDDLVSFWTFGEAAGSPKVSRSGEFPLTDGNAALVARTVGGPFSGYSASFNGTSSFLTLPNTSLGALNISGTNARVTMVAWVKRNDTNVGFLGGIWQEDNNDPRRQYGLFLDLPTYGGDDAVCGHVSWSGGPSPKFPGSSEFLPYSRDYSANRSPVMNGRWTTVAFTYDGSAARSYIDGQFEERASYTEPGPSVGYGLTYAKNPYAFTNGLGNNGGNFTVGSVKLTAGMSNHYKGEIGGLAVYDRALTAQEMFRLHAAMLDAGQPVADFGFRNTGSGVIPVNDVVWKAFRSATVNATSNTSNGWAIGGTVGMGSEIGYLYKNLTGQAGIAWTDAVPAMPTTVLEKIEFHLNNSNNTDQLRLAIRVGGQWFVTAATFSMTADGNTADQWNNSELKTFTWTRDAAAWRNLSFNQSNTLTIGGQPANDLPSGGIESVGFYQPANSGVLRIDQLQLHAHLSDVAQSHRHGWKWSAEYFSRDERNDPLVSGALADPDGDGRSNLLERAFGSHPRNPDTSVGALSATAVGGRLTLTYPSAEPVLSYVPEVAEDLAGPWLSGNDHIEISPGPGSGVSVASDRILIRDAPRRFMRLKVIDSGE